MISSALSDPPTYDDIKEAADRLHGFAVETPLLESPLLNDELGFRLLVKAEVLQRTGSFKFRGAYNRLSHMSPEDRRRGVVAFSSGNHAQGVAASAKIFGAPAVIIMPKDAPALKVANTRAYGAEVVLYDRKTEDREVIGEQIAKKRGLTLVRPFDDPYIIAGQGTAGIEIVRAARARGIPLDAVLVPCGGGGLTAGLALAIHAESPGTKVWLVEPEGWDDWKKSLESGRIERTDDQGSMLCDALLTPSPGKITFEINRRLVAGALDVGDEAVLRAMAVAWKYFKVVVEPGGVVGLAAALSGAIQTQGQTICAVCSGGNVDPAIYRTALERFA
ncbi:MAG: threonine/serine dehydratase [Alphaproteobacteria bacterium]|nr:threonine/serine dehydratase [Alphaproteobacteria bacterium]